MAIVGIGRVMPRNRQADPGQVLTAVTEGLFKREEFIGTKYHPADDLVVSLLRGVKIVTRSSSVSYARLWRFLTALSWQLP